MLDLQHLGASWFFFGGGGVVKREQDVGHLFSVEGGKRNPRSGDSLMVCTKSGLIGLSILR